jgi:hypothetical protein
VGVYDDVSIYYLQKMSTRWECLDGTYQKVKILSYEASHQ